MKKIIGFAVCAGVLVSSQGFAALRVTTLNCGGLLAPHGNTLLKVGYALEIRSGFDTHARNPDGSFGAPIGPFFQLISKELSPNAQPNRTDLALVTRDASGNYILKGGTNIDAIVNQNFTQGKLQIDAAKALCN